MALARIFLFTFVFLVLALALLSSAAEGASHRPPRHGSKHRRHSLKAQRRHSLKGPHHRGVKSHRSHPRFKSPPSLPAFKAPLPLPTFKAPLPPPLFKGSVFDVTKYGAIGDGESDGALAFIQAWNAACQSNGAAKVLIPPGTYMAGEVFFVGPCNCSKPITVEVQGTILAQTDLSEYPNGQWFSIENVDGVVVTGGGTFNGRGEASWRSECSIETATCTPLPPSIGFMNVNNSAIEGITLVNSKGIGIKITKSQNLALQNLNITAPPNSPHTDGIHISNSDHITVTSCDIGTGSDCITEGEGITNILTSANKCSPGLPLIPDEYLNK